MPRSFSIIQSISQLFRKPQRQLSKQIEKDKFKELNKSNSQEIYKVQSKEDNENQKAKIPFNPELLAIQFIIQSHVKTTIKCVYVPKYSHTFYTKNDISNNEWQQLSIKVFDDERDRTDFLDKLAYSSPIQFYSLGQLLWLFLPITGHRIQVGYKRGTKLSAVYYL